MPGGPIPNGPLWQPSPMQPNPQGHIPGLHQPGSLVPQALVTRPAASLGDADDAFAREKDRQRVHEDSQTEYRIAELARHLITTRPGDSRPIVVDVEVPQPLGRSKAGRAEVYRAWPIGRMEFSVPSNKENNEEHEAGVNADGRLVILTNATPSVAFSKALRWRDPADWGQPTGRHWRADVLSALELAATREATAASAELPMSNLSGRALSPREKRNLSRLQQKAFELTCEWQNSLNLYGTKERPRVQGKPSRQVRRVWREMEKLDRQLAETSAKVRDLDPSASSAHASRLEPQRPLAAPEASHLSPPSQTPLPPPNS